MKRTGRLLSLLLSTLFLVAMLAACGGGGTQPEGGDEPGDEVTTAKDTFVIGLDSDIVALDPARAYDYTTNPVINQITQGLLVFDNDNRVQPNLAYEWEQVDDLTYVYQILDNVTFSDGSPMTMEDVLYSLERSKDSSDTYFDWMFDNVDTMDITGDWELTVTLSVPDATWQYVLATSAGHIMKMDHVEAAGSDFGTPQAGIIGTGPYKFVSWQSGDKIVLERNENYWRDDAGYFETLEFKIISEDNSRVVALRTGDVDCVINPPASHMAELSEMEGVTITSDSGFGVTYLAFNTQKAPFDNVNVRKAVEMAVDMDAIYDNLIGNLVADKPTVLPNSEALFTLEPQRWYDYLDSKEGHVYDVEGAKALLTDAGYEDGFTFTLIVSEDTLRNTIATAMQSNLADIGVTMEIVKVPTDIHTAYQFGEEKDSDGIRKYDMLMAGWEADYPDPTGNLIPLYQGGIDYNAAAYDNAQVTELIYQQGIESDPTVRNDLIFEALDIIIEDMPYFFAFYPIKSIAYSDEYTGIEMNASWSWNLQFQNVRPVS